MLRGPFLFTKELSKRQTEGSLWLTKVLGGEFIYDKHGTLAIAHIVGVQNDVERAGTGVIIAPHWILTCAHVVDDMDLYPTQWVQGEKNKVLKTYSHHLQDVALIKLEKPALVMPGLTFDNPRASQTVYTLGYPSVPLSAEPMPIIQEGSTTTPYMKTYLDHELFLFSAIARPGNSGGPVLNEDGLIVGIVTQELSEQNEKAGMPYFAGIPTDVIRQAIVDLNQDVNLPIEDYQ